MNSAGAGFLAAEEYGSHLHGLGAESDGCHEATSISDAPSRDDGYVDPVDDPRNEREGACQGILSVAQKRAPMAAGFEAGRHDCIDTRFLEHRSFVRRCGGSHSGEMLFFSPPEGVVRAE